MVWLIGAALVLAAAGYLLWQMRYPTYTYRFRMTVEVDTPEGLKAGSSVYQVSAADGPRTLPEASIRWRKVRGEAVAVDLPEGRTLFALLKTRNQSGDDNLAYLSMKTLDPAYRNDWTESARRITERQGIISPAEVVSADYPMLVTFTDIADPTSVALVDPADLAATFGERVSLRRVVVELTDDPATTGIEKRLNWLTDPNRKRFAPDAKPDGIPLGNYRGLFSTDYR